MSTPIIKIYTKRWCSFCTAAKNLLMQKNVVFDEIRIDECPQKREEMLKVSNGAYTVPQIFINQQHIGGCDQLYQLEQQRQLDVLIQR